MALYLERLLHMEAVQTASAVVAAIVALIVVLALGWLIWKRALLDVQSKAMEVQSAALEAYESRLTQLEGEIKQLRNENAELRGIIEGKDSAVRDIVEAIADANICLHAPNCERRLLPTA